MLLNKYAIDFRVGRQDLHALFYPSVEQNICRLIQLKTKTHIETTIRIQKLLVDSYI